MRYVQFQDCLRELDLLGCLLFIVVHTYNDFITELPVTEGMMSSATHRLKCGRLSQLCPPSSASTWASEFHTTTPILPKFSRRTTCLATSSTERSSPCGVHYYIGSDHRDNGLLSWTGGHENGNPHCRHRLLHLCQRRCRRHRVQALCHVRLGVPDFMLVSRNFHIHPTVLQGPAHSSVDEAAPNLSFWKDLQGPFLSGWLMMGLLGSSRTGFVSPSYLQIRGICWLCVQ